MLLMSFDQDWKRCQQVVEAALEAWLPSADEPPQKLHQAMRYSTLNGGKRFRAVLVIMTGEMLGVDTKLLMAPAAAVECMHAYSLVHDDLPCMDDDDFRRGVPSCHIAYGESVAVLVGDALQTLAFEILANDSNLVNFTTQSGKLVQTLAKAAGSRGMVGGQVMDIDLLDSDLTNIDLTTVHRFKTAKLIQASVRLGALMSDQLNERDYEALSKYGESIGLAFQFTDDYLDEEHQEENLQEKAASLRDQAIRAVQRVHRDTANLEKIARFVVDRSF